MFIIDKIEYKLIPGTRYYAVSKCGKVYSMRYSRIIKSCRTGIGYYEVHIPRKRSYVHRLVWETWIGKIPKKLEINHSDGDKSNNHLNNLSLMTHRQNTIHREELGLGRSSTRKKIINT